MRIPQFCTSCGLVSSSSIVVTGRNNSFGNIVTSCPRCGADALGYGGIYDFVDDILRIYESDNFGRPTIEVMRVVGDQLRKKEITPQEAAQKVADINPIAGKEVKKWGRRLKEYGVPVGTLAGGLGTLIAAAVAALAFLASHKENRSNHIPIEDVPAIIQREIDKQAEDAIKNAPPRKKTYPETPAANAPLVEAKVQPVSNPKQKVRPRTDGKAPNENRRARRAKAAKNRNKRDT